MSKRITWISVSVLVLVVLCFVGKVVYGFVRPDFRDFAEYEESFIIVRDFLLDAQVYRNDAASYIVLLNEDILSISDVEPADETALLEAVRVLDEKGFDYVRVEDEYMIFWEDETGYYGVLWSHDPKTSIRSLKERSSDMKSKRITKEWYEVGVALNSI